MHVNEGLLHMSIRIYSYEINLHEHPSRTADFFLHACVFLLFRAEEAREEEEEGEERGRYMSGFLPRALLAQTLGTEELCICICL